MRNLLLTALTSGLFLSLYLMPTYAEPQSAISRYDSPALPKEFSHFDYVNPNAPQGGRLVHGVHGSFNSLNPFIARANAARGLRELTFEPLMLRNFNEPFTLYGLLAQSIEIAPDNTWVEFSLDPRARFSDGSPVTPEDVMHSVYLLQNHARVRSNYKKISRTEKTAALKVRLYISDPTDRELPLILAMMTIFPAHSVTEEVFQTVGMTPLMGSGAYEIAAVEAGKRMVFKKRGDYWGKDLPQRRGFFNFDEVIFEYYNDSNSLFEAFKVGDYDFRYEEDPAKWANGYTFNAVKSGKISLNEIEFSLPKPLRAYVFNTRKAPFDDIRVRQALTALFDFEWINKTLYAGQFERVQSYFPKSELSYIGNALSDDERLMLGAAADELPQAVMEGKSLLPVSDGRGRNRVGLKTALELFAQAGFELQKGTLVNLKTGEPFSFTLTAATSEQEQLGLTYAELLSKAGIDLRVRRADSSQLEEMRRTFDFDMIENIWFNSLSPGVEQYRYWGQAAANDPGSRNYMGVSDPKVDELIAKIVSADTRKELVDATRALDRRLTSGQYILPLFHSPALWLANWKRIGRPEAPTLYGSLWETWWQDEEKVQ